MKIFNLTKIKDVVDQSEIESILRYGGKILRVHYRIKDGWLVLLCGAEVAIEEARATARIILQRLIDNKKKLPCELCAIFLTRL